MKKSVILGTASDPALRLVKVYTPALPKRFKAAGSATVSPLRGELSNGHTRTASHGSTSDPLLSCDSLDDLSLSQLRTKIQRLKGEKAQVWGDLNRYEDWYDGKGSMHARLRDIGRLCRKLREMTDGTLESVRGEEKLKFKLESGLRRAHQLLSQPLPPPPSPLPFTPTHLPLYCFPISSIPAIISLSPSDGLVQAHFSAWTAPLSILTSYRGGNPQFTLNCLYLRDRGGGFALGFDREYRQREIRLVVTVEGARRTETIVGIRKEGADLLIWIEDKEQFPEDLSVKIPQSRISTSPLFSNDLAIKHLVERHLVMTESEGQIRLKWTTSLWNLGKRLYKSRAAESNSGFKLSAMTTDERFRTYKEFDVILGNGRVEMAGEVLAVSLHYNEVLGLYRITIEKEDFSWVMKEEDHRQDFALLKGLQFIYLQEECCTLFASLELRKLLEGLLK